MGICRFQDTAIRKRNRKFCRLPAFSVRIQQRKAKRIVTAYISAEPHLSKNLPSSWALCPGLNDHTFRSGKPGVKADFRCCDEFHLAMDAPEHGEISGQWRDGSPFFIVYKNAQNIFPMFLNIREFKGKAGISALMRAKQGAV